VPLPTDPDEALFYDAPLSRFLKALAVMADESGYVLPAGNLERAVHLRALAEAASCPEGRKQFMRLAMLYERMAALLGSAAASAPGHGMG
jgi:hypothetical protein